VGLFFHRPPLTASRDFDATETPSKPDLASAATEDGELPLLTPRVPALRALEDVDLHRLLLVPHLDRSTMGFLTRAVGAFGSHGWLDEHIFFFIYDHDVLVEELSSDLWQGGVLQYCAFSVPAFRTHQGAWLTEGGTQSCSTDLTELHGFPYLSRTEVFVYRVVDGMNLAASSPGALASLPPVLRSIHLMRFMGKPSSTS
jgi:hypothetical protein